MGHSTVGFFAGGLVIDENVTALDPIPENLDGKIRVRVDSMFAGGSAANAAVTFGRLAAMDPSNGGGMAHLYTYSEKRTPPIIVDDLESSNVHLKKMGIVPALQVNTVVSHATKIKEGLKLLFVRQAAAVKDHEREIQRALQNFERLSTALQQHPDNKAFAALLTETRGSLHGIFREMAEHLPHPAGNVESQFRTDLEGSSIIMIDMRNNDITLRAAKEGRELGKRVVLDLGRWDPNAETLIDNSDVVIASHDFSLPGGPKMSGDQILDYLASRGIKQAAVTRGDKSTLFYDHFNPGGYCRGEVRVPKETKLVSTSGAGDVMHGAATYFLARGHHFGHALWLGNRVSSLSVSFPDKRQFFDYLRIDHAGNLHVSDDFVSQEERNILQLAA